MSLPSRIPWLPALGLLLGACNDDVTCIFTTGCQGGSGGVGGSEASLPIDGQWIVDGRPAVQALFPSGAQSHPETPVVLVFSETINAETLEGALEIVPLIGGSLPGTPLVGVAQALVSNGRVLVLLPPGDLDSGDYIVRLAGDAAVTDITGQELDEDEQLGTFSVPTTPPATPRVLASFPADGAVNQSETTEIVVAFDRPMRADTVGAGSFEVQVDGADPASDPLPVPIVVSAGGIQRQDTRVFLWLSVDADEVPVRLGTEAEVELSLSPASDPIVATGMDGGTLPPKTITFETLPFAAPLSASLLSDPPEAIGLANLTDGDPEELTVEVELDAAEPDDVVDLFLFGIQRTEEDPAPLIALQRFVRLAGTAPIQTATFTREDVNLLNSNDPADTRLADGAVTFAFRARRASVISPVVVLDLDPDPDTIQDVLLDTIAPGVESLGGRLGTDAFRSDLRGLSLDGDTDPGEILRSVEVTTPLGDNGTLPPVVGSDESGLFLAAPAPLGLVAGGTTSYSFVAHDAALNSSPALDGTFTQLGAVGPGGFTPGDTLAVEVFDARSLDPLPGARVIVHADMGDGVSFPFHASAVTAADGRASVSTPGAPAVGAILTVEAAGRDLFTLHGVPSTRLSVPLAASNLAPARALGDARSTDAATVALLPGLDRRFDDSRRALELPRGFAGAPCSAAAGVVSCGYGPESIRDELLGARSFFAGDFSQTEPAFSAAQLLQAFVLALPLARADAGQAQAATLEIPFLLIDATIPVEEAAQALPAFVFRVDPGSGVDLLDLSDDPDTTGSPFVSVETLVPGLHGAIAVGQGLAFDQGSDRWNVRAALPGAVTAAGSLGSDGVVDTDPFVRVEVIDMDGNAAGVRPRLSTLQALGPSPELAALPAPALLAPAPASQTGGQAFELLLDHAIDDARSEGGLYRVELVDEAGRRWTLWQVDGAGTGDVLLRVIDPADGGGTGLADGEILATASAYAWSGFSASDLLWSDLEREFELFSRAAPVAFVKP